MCVLLGVSCTTGASCVLECLFKKTRNFSKHTRLVFILCFVQGLSRKLDGLLIAEMDLNLIRQVRDKWGFQVRHLAVHNKVRETLSVGHNSSEWSKQPDTFHPNAEEKIDCEGFGQNCSK